MIKLMIPDMPTADELLPFLRQIDEVKQYSNRGPLVRQLEADMNYVVGAPCVTATNATVALELALRSLDLPSGAECAVPAFTFAATGRAIANAGLFPVLCDVDATTWQLTPDRVPKGVDVVVPVAPFGDPVNQHEWSRFADIRGTPVVVDAAGALLGEDVAPGVDAVFSLHATKFIGAGEGGIFASTEAARVDRVRQMTAFGIGGTNAKLSEYHAAVTLASMSPARLSRKLAATQRVADCYRKHFPHMRVRHDSTIAPLLLTPDVPAPEVVKWLAAERVEAKQWYRPFLNEFWPVPGLPVTTMLRDRMIGLPFHTGLTDADVDLVCGLLKKWGAA